MHGNYISEAIHTKIAQALKGGLLLHLPLDQLTPKCCEACGDIAINVGKFARDSGLLVSLLHENSGSDLSQRS